MQHKVEMSVRLRKLQRGENGKDGVGSYMLDLDNDNIAIGLVSSEGSLYPAAGYNTCQSGIYVAGGIGGNASLTKVELVDGNDAVLASTATGGAYSNAGIGLESMTLTLTKVTIVFSTAVAHSRGERREFRLKGTMTVSDGGGTREETAYKVLTATFQPPGADGVSPVVYELKTSVNSVVIDESGVRSPLNITAWVVKRVGNEMTVLARSTAISDEGLAITYSKNGGLEASGLTASTVGATSLTWYLKKGTVVYDQETIAFAKDGKSAVSPITIDLDNENVTIPAYASGAAMSGALPIDCNAHMYDGSTEVTPTWEIATSNCTATIDTDGAISVTAVTASAKTASVTVTGTYGDAPYYAVMTISKAYQGAGGSSPIIYSIEPSVSVVHKKKDGTLSTNTIACKAWKQTGSTKVETSEKWLAYEIASGTGGSAPAAYPSSGVSVDTSTNWVKFTLYDSSAMNSVLDSETVFVVSDGADGDKGDAAVTLVATPDTILRDRRDAGYKIATLKAYAAGEEIAINSRLAKCDGTLVGTGSTVASGCVFRWVNGSPGLFFTAGCQWSGTLEITATTALGDAVCSISVKTYNTPMVRGPLDWSALSPGFEFESGGLGDDWLDIAVYNGNYYQCILNHAKGDTYPTTVNGFDVNAPIAPTNATYWKAASQLDFVATNLLLAKIAYIENLVVGMLRTTSGFNGQQIVIEGGEFAVYGPTGAKNIQIGVNDNGKSVFNYYDNSGKLLWSLGPDALTDLRESSAVTPASTMQVYQKRLSIYTSMTAEEILATYELQIKRVEDKTPLFRYSGARNANGSFTNDDEASKNGRVFTNTSCTQAADGWYVQSSSSATPTAPYTGKETMLMMGETSDYNRMNTIYLYIGGTLTETATLKWNAQLF